MMFDSEDLLTYHCLICRKKKPQTLIQMDNNVVSVKVEHTEDKTTNM